MNYIRVGKGPVLVLVHGFLSGYSYWDRQIKYLSEYFEVITMDLPGYGEVTSQTGLDEIADFADFIISLLDRLGVNNFYLIGHSMGGMIAQEIALKKPQRVKKLVLYGTGPIGNLPGRFEPLEVSQEKVKRLGTKEAATFSVKSWFLRGSDDPDYPSSLELAQRVSTQTYINGLKAMGSWSASERLDQIVSKTLVVWGNKDRTYIWEQPYSLWKGIKNSEIAVIPGCSHNIHMEKSEVFNLIIRDFLN